MGLCWALVNSREALFWATETWSKGSLFTDLALALSDKLSNRFSVHEMERLDDVIGYRWWPKEGQF